MEDLDMKAFKEYSVGMESSRIKPIKQYTLEAVVHHDLNELIGSWKEDPEFEVALRMQSKIDMNLWL